MPMHDLHHTAPLAYVGTPTVLSVSVLSVGIFAPLWYFSDLLVATGLTSGVMVGYVYYGLIHHIMHHRRNSPAHPYLNALRAVHMRHHYSAKGGNFGVTTTFWDHVFGTVIRPAGVKSASSS
jgi:sterol desaturase/sphingolipid hydroxylase (fatty acid hydroxylase superfamily)